MSVIEIFRQSGNDTVLLFGKIVILPEKWATGASSNPFGNAKNIYDSPEVLSQTFASAASIMVDAPDQGGSYNGEKFLWTGVTFSKAL